MMAVHTGALLKSMVVAVDAVSSVECASDALGANSYDLAILDVDAVAPEAVEQLQDLRVRAPEMQILVCGSSETLPLVVAAIEKGADDFILRPVRPEELRVRIQHVSARVREQVQSKDQLVAEFGPLRLDITQGDVSLDGKPLSLTPRERSVLQVLIRARGSVVSKDQIASRVFTLADDAGPRSIETYVHRLRRKAEHPDICIQTLRGLGYRLTVTAQE